MHSIIKKKLPFDLGSTDSRMSAPQAAVEPALFFRYPGLWSLCQDCWLQDAISRPPSSVVALTLKGMSKNDEGNGTVYGHDY